jgi:phage recombination protein Bet
VSNEIVRFTDDRGEQVEITPALIRASVCPNATDQEISKFLALCKYQKLNPFINDAYLIKYGNGPATMVTSRAAMEKRADEHPEYEGAEFGVVLIDGQGQMQHRQGTACYKQLGEQLIGGWARVYRKGRRPFYEEVPLSDYNTGKSQWAKMPGLMIAKVAEMHALRSAFPQTMRGMYSSEEMDQAHTATVETVIDAPAATAAQQAPAPTRADLGAVRQLFKPYMAATGFDQTAAMDAICAHVGAAAMQAMTQQQADDAAGFMREAIDRAQQEPTPVDVDPETGEVMADEDIEF